MPPQLVDKIETSIVPPKGSQDEDDKAEDLFSNYSPQPPKLDEDAQDEDNKDNASQIEDDRIAAPFSDDTAQPSQLVEDSQDEDDNDSASQHGMSGIATPRNDEISVASPCEANIDKHSSRRRTCEGKVHGATETVSVDPETATDTSVPTVGVADVEQQKQRRRTASFDATSDIQAPPSPAAPARRPQAKGKRAPKAKAVAQPKVPAKRQKVSHRRWWYGPCNGQHL